jgi:hypothetical protein
LTKGLSANAARKSIIEAKPQRAGTKRVMHAEEIVRLDQSGGRSLDPGPLRALQTASHQESSPTIRAGVGEDAKGFTALLRVLASREQAQSGIKLQIGAGAVIEREPVELEFENVATRPAPRSQHAQTKRHRQTVPVGVDRNRSGATAQAQGHAVSREASLAPAQASAPSA